MLVEGPPQANIVRPLQKTNIIINLLVPILLLKKRSTFVFDSLFYNAISSVVIPRPAPDEHLYRANIVWSTFVCVRKGVDPTPFSPRKVPLTQNGLDIPLVPKDEFVTLEIVSAAGTVLTQTFYEDADHYLVNLRGSIVRPPVASDLTAAERRFQTGFSKP